MSGYAVRSDLIGWRMVDGPNPDPLDSSKSFPDPETEYYSETQPPPPIPMPPTAEQIRYMRDNFLTIAALRIAPLQDAVDLGSATDEDKENLILWKRYRVSVNRITEQEGFPLEVEWPSSPESKGD